MEALKNGCFPLVFSKANWLMFVLFPKNVPNSTAGKQAVHLRPYVLANTRNIWDLKQHENLSFFGRRMPFCSCRMSIWNTWTCVVNQFVANVREQFKVHFQENKTLKSNTNQSKRTLFCYEKKHESRFFLTKTYCFWNFVFTLFRRVHWETLTRRHSSTLSVMEVMKSLVNYCSRKQKERMQTSLLTGYQRYTESIRDHGQQWW